MAPLLLFITGVLAGLIAGFILSRLFQRGSTGDGAGERRLLEERLLKADQGLEQFSRQLEVQSAELKGIQQEALQAREAAAISLGLPRFRGQVDRSHAMTLRLSIDDQPDQDQAPVHGAAKAGGCSALPQ